MTNQSNIQFICNTCVDEPTTSNTIETSIADTPRAKNQKTKSANSTPNVTQKVLLTSATADLIEIKDMVKSIKETVGKSAIDIIAVKNQQKQHAIDNSKKISSFGPKTNPSKTPLYTTMRVQSDYPSTSKGILINETPQTNKRKRNEIIVVDNSTSKRVASANIPTPKFGTKDIQIGKPLEQHTIKPRSPKIQFEKPVHISKFHPDTTTDEIIEYVVANTELKDKSKMKCIKLVKKDQVISKLSFVSFKLGVAPEYFDNICKPSSWPKGIAVRVFVGVAAPKPNRKLPVMNTPSSDMGPASKVPRTLTLIDFMSLSVVDKIVGANEQPAPVVNNEQQNQNFRETTLLTSA